MRGRKKIRIFKAGVICTAFLIGNAYLGATTVCAGDINDAESMIISYYNGTFQYEGKTYVATEAAKATAYNKLVADDVNLTYSEARSAIAQANSRIAEGISEGYLVELEAVSNPEENGSQEGNDSQEGNGPQEEQGAQEEDNPQVSHENQTPSDIPPDTSDSKEESDYSDEKKKIDKEEIRQDTEKNTTIKQDGNLISITRYDSGEQLLVKEDGTVVYEGELPLKNTGYNHAKGMTLIKAILFSAAGFLVLGIGNLFYKERRNEK